MPGTLFGCLLLTTLLGSSLQSEVPPQCYGSTVLRFEPAPVLSQLQGQSTFSQVFNPSWIQASAGTNGRAGLLVRAQNCTATPGQCLSCSGTGQQASSLVFAELTNNDNVSAPQFSAVSSEDVVFGPHDATDDKGTEDPRVAYDPSSGLYYTFYTCYNSGKAPNQTAVTLCLATSPDPTTRSNWTRLGPVGFGQDSKSAAVLIREHPPHFLFWGAGQIRVTSSQSLTHWPSPGTVVINQTLWSNPNVEAGPPPMRLSTGDYVFFFNSWSEDFPAKGPGYQPAWAVLSGDDPSKILAQATEPLWSPQRAGWMEGRAPYDCNVPNVSFLEAAHPTDQPDTFRVYFGGADAVVGSGVVRIKPTEHACSGAH